MTIIYVGGVIGTVIIARVIFILSLLPLTLVSGCDEEDYEYKYDPQVDIPEERLDFPSRLQEGNCNLNTDCTEPTEEW